MFTGIIRTIGQISNIETEKDDAVVLTITTPSSDLHEGDSVSVNGVCLTVLSNSTESWTARLMQETLNKTNLGNLTVDQPVNLELPVQASDALHGHIVQGHVDGTGKITVITPKGDDRIFEIHASPQVLKNIIQKGSIALEGVSLTVVDITEMSFTVSLMPYTLSHTTLGEKKIGDVLNIETDKHVSALWLSGVVVEGDKRGTGLGFPTANIQLDEKNTSIAEGVYAVRAMIAGDPTIYAGALHNGPRPTFPGATDSAEIHLINFPARDLYGQHISFTVIKKVREIEKFKSIEKLIEIIKNDVQVATSILLKPE
jgi:riboflavin synthase